MKIPKSWHEVSVFQWQQLAALKDEAENETDLAVKTISIITGKTENEIKRMNFDEVAKLSKAISFLNTSEMPLQKVKTIKANGNVYRVNYDIKNADVSRYIEAKHFASDFVNNIHKIAASMVVPQRLTITGYKDAEYIASEHERYSNELQQASIVDVMGSVVFFYLVFKTWIKVFRDYFITQMTEKGMTSQQAEIAHLALCDSLDGFIKLQSSLRMSV